MERELFGRVLQLCNSALVALAVSLKLEVGQFYDGNAEKCDVELWTNDLDSNSPALVN
jgi:hypothetical protein